MTEATTSPAADGLLSLLREVLEAPTNHRGHRSEPWYPGMTPEEDRARGVIAYTAKRLPDDLLDRIQAATNIGSNPD
jgi:hypothetical protein